MSISAQITALDTDKTAIANAITAKGGTLSQNAGFDTFASDIGTIDKNASLKNLISGSLTLIPAEMLAGLTTIEDYMFYSHVNLEGIELPETLLSIGSNVFAYCTALTSIFIPDSVTTIGASLVRACTGITTIRIGSGVTSIGAAAFYDCSRLTSFTITAVSPPELANTNTFNNTNGCPIYVPAGSVNAYKNAPKWSNYASRIQAIPNGGEGI